ncbi:PLP-dependent aspartate aminotransferase family protein [Halorussus sp. MSC15.2]|uniref:trans-sulfuration enzyme family protein n=1 Tax=Halorussus sp. MSC15.2 TaxID=2283638 RepID=UPI0013D03C53|nr:PLP-dependent aspartate aminotransferase family protein [Halorussus sp. MSC15.2]NEU55680.1 PLP-dependent transferase [Halorussus sp. MSC15.2]
MADDRQFETREVHSGRGRGEHGALAPPIQTTATYEYETPTETRGDYRYSRMAEPTRDRLEATFAGMAGGTHGSAFASGMAAIDAVFSLLSSGDHVVAGANLYAESHELLTEVYAEYGVEVTHVEITDAEAVADAMTPDTALVYFETPTNPVLRVGDVAAIAEVAADRDALCAVDNTFASPYLQRPLELGADVVVESLTKYVGGHSDLIAGAVATDDEAVAERLDYVQYARGAIPSAFDCFLALRGVKTLSARMDRHCRNARAVAEWLDDHPQVRTVYYPGLASHENHAVAARQMADFGGMVSFELEGGVEEAARFAANLDVFTLAESLGGVESLAEVPAVMTHQDFSPEALAEAGIGETLVRLSVGTEHPDDLLADLDGAVEATFEVAAE